MADYSNLTSDSLRKLTRIVERRDNLLEEINKINAKIAEILGGSPAEETPARAASAAAAPATGRRGRPSKAASATAGKTKTSKAAKTSTGKRGGRVGGLRDAVLAALRAAGAAGASVKEVAEKIGAKPQNLHVWFSTTGKKFPEIIRVGPGRYALQSPHQQPQA